MKRSIALLAASLLPLAAVAADESPSQALAKFPPLPKAAAKNLDCSLGETLRKKSEAVAQQAATTAQAAGGAPPSSMTPEQVQAMQAMTEPQFNTCPIDIMQPEAQGWANAAEEKLAARLAEIAEAKEKADMKWCETHSTGEMCADNPAGRRKAQADAAAAGTQFLKDVQPGYAKLIKLIGDCVAFREKPLAAAQSLKGAFQPMVAGAHAGNWALVAGAAEAHSRACGKALDAAREHPDP